MDNEILKYVESPQQLLDILSKVIEYLEEVNNSTELHHKNIQLQEINKAIQSLEKKGIAVPDSLRTEKNKLVCIISDMSTMPKLQLLQNGLEDIIKTLDTENQSTKKLQKAKNRQPKTESAILRKVLLEVLKNAGGKAKVSDIKVQMNEILKEKLLPGDLELRGDGRTLVWFNNVQWERLKLVQSGILKNDSQIGYWELSGDDI